jgi:hypothetical protein
LDENDTGRHPIRADCADDRRVEPSVSLKPIEQVGSACEFSEQLVERSGAEVVKMLG